MARRTSERLSVAASSGVDESVDDERTLRESWLCRSTICASEGEDDNDAEACTWSQLHTPTPFDVALVQRRDSDEANTWHELKDDATKAAEEQSLSSQLRKGKRKLPLLPGFSNTEALRAQLPRSTSKQAQIARSSDIAKDKGLINSGLTQTSTDLSPSIDEVEANRRKWDLERKLQSADQNYCSVGIVERKNEVERNLNPVTLTDAEVEANRRKWDLERRLQDSGRIGVSVNSNNSPDRKRDFKRKLQSLNPFTMKMNPVVPSAAEMQANQRKWDLERRLEDANRIGASVNAFGGSERNCELARKLPALNTCTISINPVLPSTAEVEANRRKWDLERRLQDGDKMAVSVNAICGPEQPHKLPTLNLVASTVSGAKMNRQKREFESAFCTMEGQLKFNGHDSDRAAKNQELEVLSSTCVSDRQKQGDFKINEPLVYLLLFSSTAVLHCAVFNFNLELRQFLRLDIYPFGILLLLSWTFVGLIQFVGGLVGDLVQDRVLLLRYAAVLWGIAVVAFHIAAFQLSSVVSSISLVSGLLCAGVAHGVVCPNVIALSVESKLCSSVVPMPLSPEEAESSSSDDEDSAAESESSYLSDISSIVSDEQQESDLASHNFFTGCFAARLAGSSLMQGYYFLLANVDTISSGNPPTPTASRGIHCMLLMSVGLLASLIFFCFQSWDYQQSGESSLCELTDDVMLERKLATLERGFNASIEAFWTWSWTNLVRLCNRALVGYALLSFILMTLIGAAFSLVVVLLASQTSLSVRVVAFLLIVIGWLLTMTTISRQLNPTKRQLLRECRRMGLRSHQLYLVIFTVAFICVSGCVSFLRAQPYTTMVVQVCQTQLLIPGTVNTLFDPELLGTVVGTSSLVLVVLSRVLSKNPLSPESPSSEIALTMFAPPTPTTPVPQKTWKQSLSLHLLTSMASFPPVTRMCFAMLLYLISVFLSSVVELYRRKAGTSPSLLPRSCGAAHSEFTFLWTSPYVILLGVSDALFRVSLQEACHNLSRNSLVSSTSSRRWTGTVQGTISLAEALGYTTALSLVAVLSRWLFQPELTDMALLFLLLTTVVALTHAVLNRIASRALSYQRLYFSIRSSSTN